MQEIYKWKWCRVLVSHMSRHMCYMRHVCHVCQVWASGVSLKRASKMQLSTHGHMDGRRNWGFLEVSFGLIRERIQGIKAKKSWSSGQGGEHMSEFENHNSQKHNCSCSQITVFMHFCRKNCSMRIFVAKVTTYAYFCRKNQNIPALLLQKYNICVRHENWNICALLSQKAQHSNVQILYIIEKKFAHYIILLEQE